MNNLLRSLCCTWLVACSAPAPDAPPRTDEAPADAGAGGATRSGPDARLAPGPTPDGPTSTPPDGAPAPDAAPPPDALPPAADGSAGGAGPTVGCAGGSGRRFEVGPGQPLGSLADVPWSTLAAGDTVLVHARAEPYREKVLVSTRGTEDAPIRICGVAGPAGEPPVLEGEDATTPPTSQWSSWVPLQDLGVVTLAAGAGQPYGSRPGYVLIEGLEIRGAHRDHGYTASTGERRTYANGAASIVIVPGDHVTIRGCTLTGSGQGLFTLSKSEVEGTLVRELVVEGNHLFGNGVVGSDRQHNAYVQALGVTIQWNRFGPLRAGALGGNLKDRSAGTVVRYNLIEGGARLVDLVDAQEHAASALADPRYRETFLYGNVLVSPPGAAGNQIHYGGDTQGFEQNFRKGTLYAYHNTILVTRDLAETYNVQILDVSTDDETVDFRNNVVHRVGTSGLYLMHHAGRVTLGANWITEGWLPGRTDFTGTIAGAEQMLTGADPGLDAERRPAAASPLRDRSAPLVGSAATRDVDREYAPDAQSTTRATTGDAADLGALEGR